MTPDYLEDIARQIQKRYGPSFGYCSLLVGLIMLQMLNHDEAITYESLLKKLQDSEVDNILKQAKSGESQYEN